MSFVFSDRFVMISGHACVPIGMGDCLLHKLERWNKQLLKGVCAIYRVAKV